MADDAITQAMTFTEICEKMLHEQLEQQEFTVSRKGLELLVNDSNRYGEQNKKFSELLVTARKIASDSTNMARDSAEWLSGRWDSHLPNFLRNIDTYRTTSLAAQDGLVEALRAALYRLTVAAEEDMNRDEPEGVDGSEIDAANTAILNSYPQVFTDEQVAKLTEWQECDLTHSLTCPNGPHGFHDEDGTPLPDDLFAHCNGLFCPHCNYRQDWAPEVCFGPLPELPATFQASLSAIRENKS